MKLRYVKPTADAQKDDIARIVRACAAAGFEIEPSDAVLAWESFSGGVCAQWLGLPESDAEIVESIMPFCEREDGG